MSMKTLPEPAFNSREVIESCTSRIHNRELAERICSVIPYVENIEQGYKELGVTGGLFEIPSEASVNGVVSSLEMIKLYEGSLSKKGSSSRHYYDKIKLEAKNDICPLCSQRVVKTLDHYLPKSSHPALAVSPINLIPACSDCNKLKLDHLAVAAEDQTLHPYFDDVSSLVWLEATVMESSPPSVLYKVHESSSADQVLIKRIRRHFEVFGLQELYASQAASEMVSIRYALLEFFESSGVDGLKSFLGHQARTRSKADSNSWSAALYRAISESEWFCETGHKHLHR
ncbi:MAG: hypothetical protein Q7T36_07585 [Fluviicoccus sp.]|uniref:HNH endonuclease n=1 Tax=Fluviicoccus sp. TaxID=2003552 RepID=UPI00271E1F81|nr:hypothetical protein [Fluviicoccus sp.]MDO8330314.1 hypothetical protein [Fluviicoccus sp.]